MLELDFGDAPEKLKGEYLDMYKGIQSEVISSTMRIQTKVLHI